jgi:type IV pilus assembly protein PilE
MKKSAVHSRGFTLIEIMIVVAIIAVIAAIALPNYQDSIRASRRGAAASCMLEMAQQMERRFTTSLAYNATTTFPAVACTTAINDYYTFQFASSEPTTSTYVIRASPIGAQDDACGILLFNERTIKGAADATTDAALIKRCWK